MSQGILPLLPSALYRTLLALRHPSDLLQATNRPWNNYSPIRTDFAREHNVVERAHASGWNFHSQQVYDSNAVRLLMFALSSPIADLAAAYKAMYGVETRDVPADSRLVEFCMRIPEDQWLQKGVDRSLLRRTMKERLPEMILQNRLRGLQAADWMNSLQGVVPEINQELIRLRKSSLAKNAIDFDRLDKLAAALPHDNNNPMQQTLDYRNTLQRGLMVGRFLYWFETGD
jgi:asparagine synthase (glutamine-hydrolysing)